MNTNFSKAIEILEKYNQTHIIPFLENGENVKLINQVLETNFEILKDLYNRATMEVPVELEELKPITSLNPDKLPYEELQKIKNIGIDIIKQNKFAVSTMAGRTRNKASDTANQKVHIN